MLIMIENNSCRWWAIAISSVVRIRAQEQSRLFGVHTRSSAAGNGGSLVVRCSRAVSLEFESCWFDAASVDCTAAVHSPGGRLSVAFGFVETSLVARQTIATSTTILTTTPNR
jgi:hypothetical protein